MRRGAHLAALLAALLAATARLGAADPAWEAAQWADPAHVRVQIEELAFRRFDHPATSTESFFMLARYNGGHVLIFDLFDLDSPLVSRWGIYVLVTDPLGHRYWTTHVFDRSRVRTDAGGLGFSDGASTVDGDGSSWRISLRLEGFACDLLVRTELPAWRGGDGVDELTPDGRMYERRLLPCPLGEVTGWLSAGGPAVEVNGQALLERTTRVTPLGRMHQCLYSLRAWSVPWAPDRLFLEMLEMTSHAAYGGKRIPRLGVATPEGWLFTTREYSLEPAEFSRAGKAPYPAPAVLRISARDRGYVLPAEYRAETLFDVTDVITEVPLILRPIVAAFFTRPVYLRFLGVLTGTLTRPDGTPVSFELRGPFEYVLPR